MLEKGQPLPPLALGDQDGKQRGLADLAGPAGLLLFVYSRDNTSGCSTEAAEFQELAGDFTALGYGLAGISRDTAASHTRFAAKLGLTYPLLSDPDAEYLRALGAWGEKKLYGKAVQGAIRSTFIFDSGGRVQRVYPKVKAKGHARAVLADLSPTPAKE